MSKGIDFSVREDYKLTSVLEHFIKPLMKHTIKCSLGLKRICSENKRTRKGFQDPMILLESHA